MNSNLNVINYRMYIVKSNKKEVEAKSETKSEIMLRFYNKNYELKDNLFFLILGIGINFKIEYYLKKLKIEKYTNYIFPFLFLFQSFLYYYICHRRRWNNILEGRKEYPIKSSWEERVDVFEEDYSKELNLE